MFIDFKSLNLFFVITIFMIIYQEGEAGCRCRRWRAYDNEHSAWGGNGGWWGDNRGNWYGIDYDWRDESHHLHAYYPRFKRHCPNRCITEREDEGVDGGALYINIRGG